MRNGIIIEIKGLGIPVQVHSLRNSQETEVRWSSDPDVPVDAPAHVLIGHKELQRFIELAVDRRFVVADLMKLTPVELESGKNTVSRNAAIAAGVSPDNWDLVRVALVISGNGARGSVADQIEWVGSREEHNEGGHLREAYAHAQRRGIKAPAIFTHADHDCGQILQAAEFFHEFRRQLKPSLHATDVLTRALETNLCSLDLARINPDRAAHYLREIQTAFIQSRNQRLMELEDSGRLDDAGGLHYVEPESPAKPHSSSSLKFH